MADRIVTIAVDEDRARLKAAYQQALTDLQAIQTKTSWTNAEAIAAIKRLADIQEKVLKLMASKING